MWYAVFICTSGQNVVFGVNCHHGAALYPDGAKLNAFGIFKKNHMFSQFWHGFQTKCTENKNVPALLFWPLMEPMWHLNLFKC